MKKKEQLQDDGRSDLPASRTAKLRQEEDGESAADHSFADEMFDYTAFDDDNAALPAVDDSSNNGGSMAAKDDECSQPIPLPLTVLLPHEPSQLQHYSIAAPPQPFCNNSSPDINHPFSDEPTCRSRLIDSGLPGDVCEPQLLLEHLPEDPDTDWMKYLVLEPDSDEELLISEITATPSQPTHLVDYPFNAAAASSAAVDFEATLPAFNSEVMLPDKEVITRKRDHNTAHIWSPHLDPITESSSLVHSDAGIINPNPVKPPAKKRETSPDGVARRCQHCATDKTPQWRAGPMGPKSLCNACGVRYKSGRLMPEYRPALSPTFAVSEHSNSHRKVCEIRRQKGLPTEPYPPVNEGAVAAREGAAATAIQVTIPGHNFFTYPHPHPHPHPHPQPHPHQNQGQYKHLYLPDILQNF